MDEDDKLCNSATFVAERGVQSSVHSLLARTEFRRQVFGKPVASVFSRLNCGDIDALKLRFGVNSFVLDIISH
jgi:hypothetical protein